MKAAVFEATKKPLVVKTVPDPQCEPTSAIVRVEANGICRSDCHAGSGDCTWMALAAQPGALLGPGFTGVDDEAVEAALNFKKGARGDVPLRHVPVAPR